MKLFDLHCDTATRLLYENQPLYDNGFHVSLKKAEQYEKYIQLTAVFTSTKLSDEDGWEKFWEVRENLLAETEKNGATMIKTARDLEEFGKSDKKYGFILTVEDARILCGKLGRVRELYDAGVRVITPLWGGETVIGGSHDTDKGLTDFGREAVCEMLKLGIIPDISHASFKSADEIIELCEKHGKVAFASHSDAYSVNPHSRNLTDDRFMRIAARGGIVGVNLCRLHLTKTPESASIDDVCDNILHFKELSPASVAFGCDMDGTDLPDGIDDISSLPKITNRLAETGVDSGFIEKLSYNTAFEFMNNNLPKE